MKTEIVNPNISNFIESLRDLGYTFEIAVADIIDNCISANASNIEIYTVPTPEITLHILDNGHGMTEEELTEAMRLATKNPSETRANQDLGRFGLGLKTASFSQCKKLTVISKKNESISVKQWDLDFISKENQWKLITPEITQFKNYIFYNKLELSISGTLVIWEEIDRYKSEHFTPKIEILRSHLSLVFHRFLEGSDSFNRLTIILNNNPLKPFNPFNANHAATMEKETEIIKIFNHPIKITPFLLPHHSKTSQQEWNTLATNDGYIKSQGFYLYRLNRLLIHGTWWGLHKATDAHKLVRIKIDITNQQDKYWGIDIKKSTAHPIPELKKDLKRIIGQVTKEGARPFTKRGRKITDKTITRFWEIIPIDNEFRFCLNRTHPIYNKLLQNLSTESIYWLNTYLKSIEAYLPLESIQSQLQQNPHELKQKKALSNNDIIELVKALKKSGLDDEYIEKLLKTEIFKNNKNLLQKDE